MTNSKSLGELAYDGYKDHTNGKTWNGYPMPEWADLPHAVRLAWDAGAAAVRQSVLHDVVNMIQTEIAAEQADKAGQP